MSVYLIWDSVSKSFYGSGIRLEAGRVIFSTTSSPIDRLIYCKFKNSIFVSNSIVALLAATGARLGIEHDYRPEIREFGKRLNPYDRTSRVIHPTIKCFYQAFLIQY